MLRFNGRNDAIYSYAEVKVWEFSLNLVSDGGIVASISISGCQSNSGICVPKVRLCNNQWLY